MRSTRSPSMCSHAPPLTTRPHSPGANTSPSNPRAEHYVGKFLTAEEARARTGIETVFLTTEFDAFLSAMFNRRPYGLPVDAARDNTDYSGFFKALDDGSARLALRLESTPGVNEPLSE